MYFVLLAWRKPPEVETCCQMKNVVHTSCVDSYLFLLLLYLVQRDEKVKAIGHYSYKDSVANINFRVFIEPCWIFLRNLVTRTITDNLVPRCVFCKQSQIRSLFNSFHFKYEIRHFHGCDYAEYCFLGCDDVKSATNLQMFRGNKQPFFFRVTRQCIYTTVEYLVTSPH
jgi:hypothetical protein